MPKNGVTLILARHCQREINTGEKSGDGPLTVFGTEQINQLGYAIADDLIRGFGDRAVVDLAIVSGSIRCAQTFSRIWTCLLNSKIPVREYDMDKRYFSTKEEDVLWDEFYREKGELFRSDKERIGETAAYLKHVEDLITRCVCRTQLRINKAVEEGCKTILVVTHGPHDALLERDYTGVMPAQGLELGKHKIITF